MIYTLGFAEHYLEKYTDAIVKKRIFVKTGIRDWYRGGSVWQTQEEAQKHIDDNQPRLSGYAVFGVVAKWIKNTVPTMNSKDLTVQNLFTDSRLILLDDVDYDAIINVNNTF